MAVQAPRSSGISFIEEYTFSDDENECKMAPTPRGSPTPSNDSPEPSLQSRSPSIGTTLSVDDSEVKAAGTLHRLEIFVQYDTKWWKIRQGILEEPFTFAQFPWPSTWPIERGEFLTAMNREKIYQFLYEPLRLYAREVDENEILEHEKKNWVMDKDLLEKRVRDNVVQSDQYLVREACHVVSLYIWGANDSDKSIAIHKNAVQRGVDTYPLVPPVVAYRDFPLVIGALSRSGSLANSGTFSNLGYSSNSSRCLDKSLSRRFLSRNEVLQDIEPERARADTCATPLEQSSQDSLFSQSGPIIFGSSQETEVSDMEEVICDSLAGSQDTEYSEVEPLVPTQRLGTPEDANGEVALFLWDEDETPSSPIRYDIRDLEEVALRPEDLENDDLRYIE